MEPWHHSCSWDSSQSTPQPMDPDPPGSEASAPPRAGRTEQSCGARQLGRELVLPEGGHGSAKGFAQLRDEEVRRSLVPPPPATQPKPRPRSRLLPLRLG